MSQPVNRPPPAGLAEAESYVHVRFRVMERNGNFHTEEADCLINAVIIGLKEDLRSQLGSPVTQNWFYEGELMLDHKRLQDYGIDGREDIQMEVKPWTM